MMKKVCHRATTCVIVLLHTGQITNSLIKRHLPSQAHCIAVSQSKRSAAGGLLSHAGR